MDGSIAFARWRQYALMGGHIGAIWWIKLNLCFLRLTRVQFPRANQLLQPFCRAHGRVSLGSLASGATWWIRLNMNLCVLRPTRVHNPNGKSIGSVIFPQLTAESLYIGWSDVTYLWSRYDRHFVQQHGHTVRSKRVKICRVIWTKLFKKNVCIIAILLRKWC